MLLSLQPVFADTSWLKRIVITWIVLNSLGSIVTYLQPLIAGGNYTGP